LSLGESLEKVFVILDDLSSKDRVKALRALTGAYGHRFLPGTGIIPTSVSKPVITAVRRPKVSAQKSKKSPSQKKVSQEISLLNKEISNKSRELGTRLPDTHPLLTKRSKLFRDLKEGKGETLPP
jgi:hypothetical protein